MRSAILRGREHPELRAIATLGEGPLAIALSRGGAAKTYPHTDPNEDAAAFASGPAGCVLAVADGHSGFEAAEVVIEHWLSHPAPHWTDGTDWKGEPAVPHEAWRRQALAALRDAGRDVLRERVQEGGGVAATTFSTLFVRREGGEASLLCIGDSPIFAVDREGRAHQLAPGEDAAKGFLGSVDPDGEELEETCQIARVPLQEVAALVCATDGLSEPGVGVADPIAAVAEAFEVATRAPRALRPLTLARELCEGACQAHRIGRSGDNIAIAVAWMEEA